MNKLRFHEGSKNYGSSWINWIVFDRAAQNAEAEAEKRYERWCELQGSRGPGEQFAKHPSMTKTARRILITQHMGWDV